MEKNFKKQKGFTIIELIISIFILSVAVVGIFSAFSIVIILTSDSADRLTGTYLAQEGMEIVRNIRDTNWLNMNCCSSGASTCGAVCPATWSDGLLDKGCETVGCEADYTYSAMAQCPSTGANSNTPCSYLNLDTDNYFYNYTTGTPTRFKRKITIVPITDVGGKVTDASGNEVYHIMKVTVQVSWDEKANILFGRQYAGSCDVTNSNCITAETTLYDWYNYVPPPPIAPPASSPAS